MSEIYDEFDLLVCEKQAAKFNVESTRPAFEMQLVKELPTLSEEEIKDDFLARNPLEPEGYKNADVDNEWHGWKRGVMLGYELWGKK